MPENNQILSVEGQLVGIPVQEYTAGPGIVVDNVNKTVRTDKTVLFETDTPASVTTITLSETTMNFEYIEVDVVAGNTSNSNIGFLNTKFSPAFVHGNGGYWWSRIYFDGNSGTSTSFSIHTCDSKWKNVDTAVWTRVFQRLDSLSNEDNNGWFRIRKIVGIGRKENA